MESRSELRLASPAFGSSKWFDEGDTTRLEVNCQISLLALAAGLPQRKLCLLTIFVHVIIQAKPIVFKLRR